MSMADQLSAVFSALADPTRRDLVARLTPQVAALASRSELTFDARVPADLPLVNGDGHRVEQILLNLLSNAIKYNRPGGSVTLSARATGGGIEISVVDTGIGIARSNAQRVFEPFYRADSTPTKHSSSGLGLALAKRLVEGQGGTIGFTSKPGAGTTFRVVLPAAS